MQFKTLVFASLASVGLSQATGTSSASSAIGTSTCAAQNVVDLCISTTKAQVNACSQIDWPCLCTAWGVVLTCYNNCPNDPNVFSVQSTRDAMCNAASAYPSKTTSAASTSATAAATTLTSSATSVIHSGTATASGTAASASTHNAAPGLQVGGNMICLALVGLGMLV